MLPFTARVAATAAAAATTAAAWGPGVGVGAARHSHSLRCLLPTPRGRAFLSPSSTPARLLHSPALTPGAPAKVVPPPPGLARGFAAGGAAARGALSRAGRTADGARAGGGVVRGVAACVGRTARRPASTATAPLAAPTPTTPPLLATTTAVAAGLPPHARRALAWWLGGCAAWVASMVALGGATRLTRSGLSMTDWKFTGERPPSTLAEWDAEFGKYKQSPEYKRVNRGMSLDDFKFIYWMEWAHRMWGRTLGLAFLGPAAVFAAKGWVRGPLARRLGLLGAAGGAQGLVGWWMVRSGLEEPATPWETPRVSPLRLAAHLTSAFAIYLGLLYTALQLAFPGPPAWVVAGASPAASAAIASLRRAAHPLAGIIALTALSGAFVAGLDAGRAFNTWPEMGGPGVYLPAEYWEEGGLGGGASGTAPAQFHHRTLAYTTLASSLGVWAAHRRVPGLPLPARRALAALPALALAQASLGILTLLSHVPPALGTAHQVGALTLLSGAVGLIFTVRRGPAGAAAVVAGVKRVL